MAYYLVQTLNALSFSVLLLLTGLGLSLVLSLMNFVNLTHGAFYLLGGYVGIYWLAAGWPWWLSLPAAFVAAGVAGWLLDRYPFGRFYGRTHLMQVLLTYGLSIIFADLMRWGFGADTLSPALPDWLRGVSFVLGMPFPLYRLVLIALGVALAGLLWWLVERTLWGTVVRACVADRGIVETLCIDTRRVFAFAMALAAGLGGLGGALGVGMQSAYPGLDEETLLQALMVVVVGGLGNFSGTVLSALVLGFVTTFSRVWWPEFASFASLGVMAALLLWRPQGLMTREVRTV